MEGQATLLDSAGIFPAVIQRPSPFCDPRPEGVVPSLIVLHHISLPAGKFGTGTPLRLLTGTLDSSRDENFFQLSDLKVSAHFFIDRNGCTSQLVPCTQRAWHAGLSSWRGRPGCNDFSIGIELEGTANTAFAEAQYEALRVLLGALKTHYPEIEEIVGHEHISPGRKQDPGGSFSWERL